MGGCVKRTRLYRRIGTTAPPRIVVRVGMEGEEWHGLISLGNFTTTEDNIVGGGVNKGSHLWSD